MNILVESMTQKTWRMLCHSR